MVRSSSWWDRSVRACCGFPCFSRLARLDIAHLGTSPRTAFPLGSAFAFGWTSCVGPVLAGVLVTAASTTTMVQAAVLLGS
ncbi:hypothetical protein G5V59_01740 [Nocardioides sp. W3-2-3]|nr:hypothetical protein [Nocardioides convexus]